ncbi:MAG: hypothetical protein ACRBBN_07200 [Methyloligellaceae bacterium]
MEALSLIFSAITAFCALYLSFVALRHTAKPEVDAKMITKKLKCGEEAGVEFEFINVGQWYAKPASVSTSAFFDFDPKFQLLKITSDSHEQYSNTELFTGDGGTHGLRIKGFHIVYGKPPVPCKIYLTAPQQAGKYKASVVLISENGANLHKEFIIECISN